MWMQSKSPYSLQMRENMDQKDSEYRNFLWNVFNSFSIFFGDKSHVGFLSYLVLVYTALRNSNNFFCENLTNLLPSLLSGTCLCLIPNGSILELLHLYTCSLHYYDESLTSVQEDQLG